MSTHFARAKQGYEFVITFYGRRIASIRDKFIDRPNEKYKHQVPVSWVTHGYVEEVKTDETV